MPSVPLTRPGLNPFFFAFSMASSTLTGSMTIRSLRDEVQLARVCIRASLYNGCFREAPGHARRVSNASVVCRLVPRFGSSGIRGLGNVDVTPDLALHVGMILGEAYGGTIVGHDPRVTGPMLVEALTAGLLSSGAPAVEAGLVSTPTLARGAREFACGAVVTASHNPAPYNGIKLWNPDWMAFDEDQQREIEETLDRARSPVPTWDGVGAISSRPDLVEQHVESILKDVGTAKLRVVVDCACGATATEIAWWPSTAKDNSSAVTRSSPSSPARKSDAASSYPWMRRWSSTIFSR